MGVSKKRISEIEQVLTKEVLIDLYVNKGYSANYIATQYFLPNYVFCVTTVIDYLKKYKIHTRNVKESSNTIFVKNVKKTSIKKIYGVDNISQHPDIKQKKEQKALEKYGVKNVFQSEVIKKKLRKTCLEKYGTEHPGTLNQTFERTSIHRKVEEVLIELKIDFKSEVIGPFSKLNILTDKIYSPKVDILIEQYKLVIECNGNIWHANPKFYKPNDIIIKYKGPTTAKKIWKLEKDRTEQIESFGYKVLTFWEDEINLDIEKVKETINEYCKNYKNSKN